MGRPNTYNAETHPQIAMGLAQRGFTLPEIGEVFGRNARTLVRWAQEHEEFRRALKTGRASADAIVEASLFTRARGGFVTEHTVRVTRQGDTIETTKIAAPETTACIFWLKNRRPEAWRDVKPIELTGKDGGPIVHANEDPKSLPLESVIAEAEALLRAAAEAQRADERAESQADVPAGEG